MAVGLKIVNGDFVIDNSGAVVTVEETTKCARDFGKMLVTSSEYEGNITDYYRYNPAYGTELNNKSLYRGLSRQALRDAVILLLNTAIDNYLRLQEARDNLNLGEIIRYVNFEVFYDVADLRNLIIEIKYGTAYNNEETTLGQFVQPIA